ncbi:MAG: tryptophan synthase subunit alpha [Eubacteriales bacterium]
MSRIEDAFTKGKAFIPFITCGDPTLEITAQLICEMEKAGADIIELGIPFSDPTAEGVVIQSANERALKQGVTTDHIFAMVEKLRDKVNVPLVFMTYANVLFSYGIERFVKRAKEIGIAGVILPDVPYEEKGEFDSICTKYGVEFISLVAPNSKNRTALIAKEAKGFIYCVSSLGVTGTRSSFANGIGEMTQFVKENSSVPCAVGFGISTPEQAKVISQYADGVIVGSAIVKLCAEHGEACIPYISEYVKNMKNALRI